MAPLIASALFVIVVTALADILIIAVLESTDDLDEIFLTCGVISGIAIAILLLVPLAIDLPLRRNGSFASTTLLGPAGVFFILKGTKAPRWLKWTFFACLYIPAFLVFTIYIFSTAQELSTAT